MVTDKGLSWTLNFFPDFLIYFSPSRKINTKKCLEETKAIFRLVFIFYADALPYKTAPIILES